MAVDNTAEIYTTINVTLAVKTAFDQLQGYLTQMMERQDETEINSGHFPEHFMNIKNSLRKLSNLKREFKV